MQNRLLALAVASFVAAGCTDPIDKAAKKRIFSPEDPPKAVASAAEKLAPERLVDDPHVARRVLQMSAAEATERLGAHRYNATVKFAWSRKVKPPEVVPPVELTETRSLIAGPGGVNGDFHATVQNSRDQGLEVIRVQGKVFARNRYGRFRERLRDRGMAEREREEVFGGMKDFAELFQGRIQLVPQGTSTVSDRLAWHYQVNLGPALAEEEGPAMSDLAEPKKGEDPSSERRRSFFDRREVTALSGDLWIDAQTSVVLKAVLHGQLRAPARGADEQATCKASLDSEITEIGAKVAVKPPKTFLPDVDKPKGIAVALDRFGLPRAGKRASEKTEPEEDQPSEEEPSSPP